MKLGNEETLQRAPVDTKLLENLADTGCARAGRGLTTGPRCRLSHRVLKVHGDVPVLVLASGDGDDDDRSSCPDNSPARKAEHAEVVLHVLPCPLPGSSSRRNHQQGQKQMFQHKLDQPPA